MISTIYKRTFQVMTAEDLQDKGKQGYPAVFGTLWQLATNSKEKFEKVMLDEKGEGWEHGHPFEEARS